jgi:N-acyl-phosphatidylethanolamine-hydrolysing phospholipase D
MLLVIKPRKHTGKTVQINMPTRSSPRSHFHKGFFRNRYSSTAHGPSWDLLKFLWGMRTSAFRTPNLPQQTPNVAWLKANREVNALTWIGHSSFLLQINGLNVVTDPHLTRRASPLRNAGPKRVNPPALDFPDLPPLDLALISHNHYDHLDERTVVRLAREHAGLTFAVPMGLRRWFDKRGISRVIELDLWQSAEVCGGRVHCVPVQHFSGRSANDRNKTLWCGFIFEHCGKKTFFAGDTGYSADFKDIGEKFAPVDLALIPIGAYEPRDFMAPVHVNPEEAVHIHRDIGSRQSVAMHWGTFRLTLEPLDEPPQKLREALRAAAIDDQKFWILQHGETRQLDAGSRDPGG